MMMGDDLKAWLAQAGSVLSLVFFFGRGVDLGNKEREANRKLAMVWIK